MAAFGFRFCWWLSRFALALPVLLLMAQLVRPDSPQAMALRLQKDSGDGRVEARKRNATNWTDSYFPTDLLGRFVRRSMGVLEAQGLGISDS